MSKGKYSENELITRSYPATFRAVEDTESERGIIEGTPIVFNQDAIIQDWAGQFVERIDPNALNGADMKDVCLFVNHETRKIPVARSKNGNPNSTMSFSIDNEGVHMRASLDVDNNAEARALHSAIKRGDMDGMSFMFRIKDQEWRDIESDMPTRIVKSISIVHEVSVVNYPAYPQTSVSARSSEETDYSPLVEARKAYAEETAGRQIDAVEVEKLKNINIIRMIREA